MVPSGLGLYEYMTFCEDVGMDAIMAVWAGTGSLTSWAPWNLDYILISRHAGYAFGESIAQADLQPYIQQAIDQVRSIIRMALCRLKAHYHYIDQFCD